MKRTQQSSFTIAYGSGEGNNALTAFGTCASLDEWILCSRLYCQTNEDPTPRDLTISTFFFRKDAKVFNVRQCLFNYFKTLGRLFDAELALTAGLTVTNFFSFDISTLQSRRNQNYH